MINSLYSVYALAGSVTLRCNPQNTAVTDRLLTRVSLEMTGKIISTFFQLQSVLFTYEIFDL